MQLQALLKAVRAGDVVVVDHLFRLGCSSLQIESILAELRDRGVAVRALDHAVDARFEQVACALGMCPSVPQR